MNRLFDNGLIMSILLLVFISITMDIQMFGQQITIDSRVRMIALGDSYTIGESVNLKQRWPHQLVSELRKQGKDVVEPDYIATTGWTTADLLEGIAGNLEREKSYNLVSILIGVNNQYQGLNINIYEPELRRIIDLAIEIAGQDTSRIFMLSIPDYAYTPFGKGDKIISRDIDAYNQICKRVAMDYGIAWIDITPISRRGLDEPVLVAGDGLHPSGEQYREWVEKIIQQQN